jgi:hypothetical protein
MIAQTSSGLEAVSSVIVLGSLAVSVALIIAVLRIWHWTAWMADQTSKQLDWIGKNVLLLAKKATESANEIDEAP